MKVNMVISYIRTTLNESSRCERYLNYLNLTDMYNQIRIAAGTKFYTNFTNETSLYLCSTK